jgi:hypothetical protein
MNSSSKEPGNMGEGLPPYFPVDLTSQNATDFFEGLGLTYGTNVSKS